MNDILRALLIAAGILFPVVILIIGVSMVAVKRGEASHASHHEEEESIHVTAGGAAAKPAKAAAAVSDEISVPQILGLGFGLFALTILALLAVSLVAHM